MTSADAVASLERTTFRSGDTQCAAVLVRPDGDGPAPCVVLGHGFGGVKEGGPIRVAELYARRGYAGLAFDYRHFGESGGEPRQLLDIGAQLDDWRAAIAHARTIEGIDPDRIALWGSSFGGGHVIEIAAGDPGVAAAVAQVPFVDGLATLRAAGAANAMRLAIAGLVDQARALAGRDPHTIPIVGAPGTTAAMNSPDAEPGYRAMYDEGVEWRNEVAARIALRVGLYRPGRQAEDLACPLLVQVAAGDAITPPGPAAAAAERAPRGELKIYPGLGHFDVYRGDAFERAAADQLEFLGRHL